jgi:hypothetical protein
MNKFLVCLLIASLATHPIILRWRHGAPPFSNAKAIHAWDQMHAYCEGNILLGPDTETCIKWADDFNNYYQHSAELITTTEVRGEVLSNTGKP